jgi:hypothetical protein
MGKEVIFWQVSLNAKTFFPVLIEDESCGRPDGLEAGKSSRVFLDMNPDRNEVLLDKR